MHVGLAMAVITSLHRYSKEGLHNLTIQHTGVADFNMQIVLPVCVGVVNCGRIKKTNARVVTPNAKRKCY